jgi:Uma2 family endonuclease
VGLKNYRVPDVMLVALPNPDLLIVQRPPLLCIEILSSADRMRKIQERLDDYAAMGVRSMWVIDPWRRIAYFAGADAVRHEVSDRLTVEGTSISITVAAIFAELDRLEARAARR